MAGMRLLPEDSDVTQAQAPAADLIFDDDRSVAADSWSIKSEYGSTLDDEQRHADATEALNYRADYSSDKDEQDSEGVSSMLGFQSYWDAVYADELANFREHGHTGEVWFGGDVMENVVSWTKGLCMDICKSHLPNHVAGTDSEPVGQREEDISGLSVLDIGTGNGLLLQELAKQGIIYWDSVSRLVAPGGLLVITSCNSTKDELVEEVDTLNQRRAGCQEPGAVEGQEASVEPPPFRYLDHIRTYPTFTFGGSVGSRVATVAFLRN